MNRSIWAGLVVGMLSISGAVRAQEAVLAELYGQGVHAYFAHDPQTAHDLLTSAIDQGSHDPRCYFFRGLCYSLLGRPDEAEADFKAGAEAEMMSSGSFPVAESLQRIQGYSRMKIEKHRQTARVTSLSRAFQAQKARFEEQQKADKAVLRASGSKPAPAAAAPAATAEKSDPFTAEPVQPEKAPAKPAEAKVAPAAPADPFGEPAAPAAPAAAPAASAPAAPAPAAGTPAPPAPDPFGTATPAPDDAKTDPFADDKPAAPAPAPAPATPAPPAADNDPFK